MEEFKRVYKGRINRLIDEVGRECCDGFVRGNQAQHSCGTLSEEEKTFTYFNGAFERLNPRQLLRALKRAMKIDGMLAPFTEELQIEKRRMSGREDENGVSSTARLT